MRTIRSFAILTFLVAIAVAWQPEPLSADPPCDWDGLCEQEAGEDCLGCPDDCEHLCICGDFICVTEVETCQNCWWDCCPENPPQYCFEDEDCPDYPWQWCVHEGVCEYWF